MQIRVIDDLGVNIGMIDETVASNMALDKGLDLVKVSDGIYRIMDLGKFNYEKSKKDKKPKSQKLKEMQFTCRISDNDYKIKVQQIIKFLKNKDLCRVLLRMKGREVSHESIATGIINRIIEDTSSVGKSSYSKNNNTFVLNIQPI